MKSSLGTLETRLFAYVQLRRVQVVRQGEVAAALRITRAQESSLLSRLARARLIARVGSGVYLVPLRLPLGGVWSPDGALALTTLMSERGARYQVCGPNAFNRYGFDEQIPNRFYAYNDKLSATRAVGGVSLTLIKVASDRLGGTEVDVNADGIELLYSSRARTLLDAVYDWSRFNSLPRAYLWIREDLRSKRVDPAELVSMALRYGDISTIRRIGALLEREGVQPALQRKLERQLSRTTSTIPWDPTAPKRGTVDRRWGAVWNERE